MATADYLHRTIYEHCIGMGANLGNSGGGGGWKGAKGGDLQILRPTQHVMETSAVFVNAQSGSVTVQFTVNLPARGRSVLGHQAMELLGQTLPTMIRDSILQFNNAVMSNASRQKSLYQSMQSHVDSVDDQVWLRRQLELNGVVAFVANGSILPRESGADDRPLQDPSVVKFESPESLKVTFDLPVTKRRVTGMGIPNGVTLIVGGGFHGKSTVLAALQLGIYNHIPGDGREFVVALDETVKIRAEDGRMVHAMDISPFVKNLPNGKDTTCFTTKDASGSTSQASNIMEVRFSCSAFLCTTFLNYNVHVLSKHVAVFFLT
jgi:predicted ABC-class ATPase